MAKPGPKPRPQAPKQEPPGVEGSQLVQLFKIDQRTLTDLATRGIVKRVGRNRYDFVASVQGYVVHLRGVASARKGQDGTDATTESALLNRERRRVLKLQTDKEAGTLIPVEYVERVCVDLVKQIRGMILGLCNEVQAEMPHLDVMDVNKIKQLSEKILRDNAFGEMVASNMHPEIQEWIDKKQGKLVI